MTIWFVLFIVNFAPCELVLNLYFTVETDKSLVQNIETKIKNEFQNKINIIKTCVYDANDVDLLIEYQDIALDLSFNIPINQKLKKLSTDYKFIILNIDKPKHTIDAWEFYTHPSINSHLVALFALISYFEWDSYIIILNEDYDMIDNMRSTY